MTPHFPAAPRPGSLLAFEDVGRKREVVTIGFTDISVEEAESFLARVQSQEQVRHDRIDDVVEPGGMRAFYVQVADDDLTTEPPSR